MASWGSTQAKVYAQTLDAALLKLVQYPDLSREGNETTAVNAPLKSF